MTAEQLKTINQLYVDLWHLVRDHHKAKSDAEWDMLAEQAEELTRKYGGEVQQLVLDTLELIERRAK